MDFFVRFLYSCFFFWFLCFHAATNKVAPSPPLDIQTTRPRFALTKDWRSRRVGDSLQSTALRSTDDNDDDDDNEIVSINSMEKKCVSPS